jgi:hypothetical protein
MTYYSTSDALGRREDALLRAKVLHVEAKALMRSPDAPTRGLPRMPDRYSVGRRPVRSGYILGTRAAGVAAAMDLVPTYQAQRPWGMTAYVEGRKASAKASAKRPTSNEAQDAIRPRLDGGSPVVLSDHEMMAALGIMPVGYLE